MYILQIYIYILLFSISTYIITYYTFCDSKSHWLLSKMRGHLRGPGTTIWWYWPEPEAFFCDFRGQDVSGSDLDVIAVAQWLVVQVRRSKWISGLHHKPKKWGPHARDAFKCHGCFILLYITLWYFMAFSDLPRVFACKRMMVKVLSKNRQRRRILFLLNVLRSSSCKSCRPIALKCRKAQLRIHSGFKLVWWSG